MKTIFTKIFLASALSFAGMAMTQNYPNDNYYGNNNYGSNGYEYYYDDYNYPDEYYYDYPNDYYTNDFYRGYYNDYRNTIVSVNWDRLFIEFNLSPWQVREIRVLNDRFSNYNHWCNYYRYNPDRWYYDRFITLERILGPRVYVTFYGRYYNNYNPIVYYRNYRVKHYTHVVYVTPRYRNVDVRTFRNDHFRNYGFRDNNSRNNNYHSVGSNNNGSFRDDNRKNNTYSSAPRNNEGFRSNNINQNANPRAYDKQDNNPRSYGNQNDRGNNGGGFRSNGASKNEGNAIKSNNGGGFRGQGNSNSSNRSQSGNGGGGRGFR